jgi:integrase
MDIRLHDLRRTFGSYQAITGASLPIIGKTLGHKSQVSTQVYARLNDDPVRDSMEKAASAMFGFESNK